MLNSVKCLKSGIGRFKLVSLLVLILMIMPLIMPSAVFAQDATPNATNGVFDDADLLTSEEEETLTKMINEALVQWNCELAFITTDNAKGMTARDYADACAEELGQAMDRSGYPGMVLLIDMDNREIWFGTQGQAIDRFSDDDIENVLDVCYGPLSDKDYYNTFVSFFSAADPYITRTSSAGGNGYGSGSGSDYGYDSDPGMPLSRVLLGSLVISLVLGGIITAIMVLRSGGTVTTNATTYMDPRKRHTDGQYDRFINKTVTRKRIPKPENRSSGGGGGGGFHTSSSGGHHGGGGRSF